MTIYLSIYLLMSAEAALCSEHLGQYVWVILIALIVLLFCYVFTRI